LQNRQNFGGMERSARGKCTSAVVNNAMNDLGYTPNKHAKQYVRDMQSALFLENLAVKFANNGDIDELQHGLDKLHNEPKQPLNQKHKGSEKMDKSNDERATEAKYAIVSKAIQFNANFAQLSKGCCMCGKERKTFGWQL
jgi:hypothetical protein